MVDSHLDPNNNDMMNENTKENIDYIAHSNDDQTFLNDNSTFNINNNTTNIKNNIDDNIINEINNDELSLHEGNQIDHSNAITYDEAINELGFGLFQILLMQVCGAGSFFDGIELSLISFVIPGIKEQWNLNAVETGALGSIVFFGMMFGAWFGGILSDKFGRKLVFCSSIFISSVFLLASCFSIHFWMLITLRFFVGIGLGAMVPCDFSLMLEYLPSKNRGALLGLLQIYWSVGAALECFISYICIEVISKQFEKGNALNDGWRWCMFFSSIFGFLIFFLRLLVPESPRFYLIKRNFKKVDQVIEKISKLNRKSLGDKKVRLAVATRTQSSMKLFTKSRDFKIEMNENNSFEEFKPLTLMNQLKMLFSKEFLYSTLLLFIIWFMLSYGGWGFNFIIPIVFEKIQHSNVYLNSFYVTSVGFLSNILTLFIIDKISRRTLMGITFMLTGLFTALVGVSYNLYAVLTFSMLANFMSSFPWALLYTYTPEFYPTSIRTTGMGACSVFTRLAGAITPMFGTLVLEYGYFIPFLTYGIALIIAGICSLLLRKETLNTSLQDVSIHQKTKDYFYSELSLNEPILNDEQDDDEGLLNERNNQIHIDNINTLNNSSNNEMMMSETVLFERNNTQSSLMNQENETNSYDYVMTSNKF